MIPHKAAVVVLQRAAQKVGGWEGLSQHLGVSAKALQRWMSGDDAVSEEVYLKAVDIVLGDAGMEPPRPSENGRGPRTTPEKR